MAIFKRNFPCQELKAKHPKVVDILEQCKYNAGVMREINEGILVEVVVVLLIIEQ
jgi:hypothetical protein